MRDFFLAVTVATKTLRRRARLCLAFLLLTVLCACAANTPPYKAYAGVDRPSTELALVRGDFHFRKDWLNSYIDVVRVQRVDDLLIENSRARAEVQLLPGMRELEVYYAWDMGARVGLATALVNYASSRESVSRILRFHAEPGKEYAIKAEPIFSGGPGGLASLLEIDFWIEDGDGLVVLSREQGRFQP
jgi:hypothetical protein